MATKKKSILPFELHRKAQILYLEQVLQGAIGAHIGRTDVRTYMRTDDGLTDRHTYGRTK